MSVEASVQTPLIISKSRGWHWYPAIRRMPDDNFLLVFSIMPDATPLNIVEPHHVMVRSTDDGWSWTMHRNLYFPVTIAGDAHICNLLSDGTVIELPNNVSVARDGSFFATTWKSTNNGITWEGPHDAPVGLPADQIDTITAPGRILAAVRFYRSFVELPNGNLVASMYARFKENDKDRCFAVQSADRGESWSFLSTIAYDPSVGTEGFCEPVIVLLPDGDILCVMRTGSGEPLYQSKSSDGGKTWSLPVSTGASGVSPDLIVMKNGMVACSYGRYQKPSEVDPSYKEVATSMGDRVMFSADGGETWTGHTTIYTGPSSGYTGIEEAASGELLYAYDTLGFGWRPFNTVRITRIQVGVVIANGQKT